MERLVCIDLPAFPLQLLLKRRPQWGNDAVVLVEDDRPQAPILWVNEKAAAMNVLPGMRYAAALSVDRSIRAAVMPASEIVISVSELARRLQRFSSRVEPSPETPGVYWLSGKGLRGLYDNVNEWVEAIHTDLVACGFDVNLCAGFTRFGTWAVARHARETVLFRTLEDEQRAARKTPLRALDIDPQFRDAMVRLGVRTVGDLCDLPVDGLQTRYGTEIARFHRQARGDLMPPLESWSVQAPPSRRFHFDFGLHRSDQLLFVFKGAFPELLEELRRRGEGLDRLEFSLRFDRPYASSSAGSGVNFSVSSSTTGPASSSAKRRSFSRPEQASSDTPSRSSTSERPGSAESSGQSWDPRMVRAELRMAATTRSERSILELLRLKLEQIELPGIVEEAEIVLHGSRLEHAQSELFENPARRNAEAAMRGLARIRAEFGDDAVQRIDVSVGHLPEAQVAITPLQDLSRPAPPDVQEDTLIRRLFAQPGPLEPRPRHPRNDGWLIRGEAAGPVTRILGPYVVSGGWWHVAIKRSYHFVDTANGELLWAYYDHVRRVWLLHGTVD